MYVVKKSHFTSSRLSLNNANQPSFRVSCIFVTINTFNLHYCKYIRRNVTGMKSIYTICAKHTYLMTNRLPLPSLQSRTTEISFRIIST